MPPAEARSPSGTARIGRAEGCRAGASRRRASASRIPQRQPARGSPAGHGFETSRYPQPSLRPNLPGKTRGPLGQPGDRAGGEAFVLVHFVADLTWIVRGSSFSLANAGRKVSYMGTTGAALACPSARIPPRATHHAHEPPTEGGALNPLLVLPADGSRHCSQATFDLALHSRCHLWARRAGMGSKAGM